MSKEDKLYKIWVYLQAEPLFWITLTLGAFLVGDYLYKKSKLNPLVNPVAISILIVSTVLLTWMCPTIDTSMEQSSFILCLDPQRLL
jgi:putative effector of murein hydrolase